MNNSNQISKLMHKTFTSTGKISYINYSARGADLVLIPCQSFTNYAMVHNCVDIDEYGITIPYEYASMVGYSYQSVYDHIEKAINTYIEKRYPYCNKSLVDSFIENEVINLLDYVCDNKQTDKYLLGLFDAQASYKRFDKYIKRSTKSIVFSYIKIEGGFVREHEVKKFDNYDDAIEYFDDRVDTFKDQKWYIDTNIDSDDIWLTDKRHEFAFEDASDNNGSHYFRLDF